jgi:predicted 2-oxoglutarate/Fe(II)-dependent dioxygenase YbiX
VFHAPPASEQAPLAAGERLCDLAFVDHRGTAFSLYANHVFGWPKALFVIGDAEGAAEAEELARFAASVRDFGQAETHVLAISQGAPEANARLVERLGLPFPVLSDAEGALYRAAGLEPGAPSCTLMLDPVLRLERRIEGAGQGEAALAHARARARTFQPMIVGAQAPALVVPNVLDRDLCRRLMAAWQDGERQDDMVAARGDGAQLANPKSKIRSDVVLAEDAPLSAEIAGAVARRLLPEVDKAFNFQVTRMERFRIGCYDAETSGFFAAHRDNTTARTAHRRYALTLNLNTGEFEGGFLRLPEYGPQLYAPPVGGAVVFSCSLLHLVAPVTKGRRFVVVGFFWGEAEQAIYERNHAEEAAGEALSV